MYKDKEQQKEAVREAVRKHRVLHQGITEQGITSGITDSVTWSTDSGTRTLTRPNQLGSNGLPEMVDNEYNPDERLPDGSKRYLGPFSDGQVLDRTTPSTDPDKVVDFYIKYGRY